MKRYIVLMTLLALSAAVAAQSIDIDGENFSFDAAPKAAGQILLFGGTVTGRDGQPIEGAEVQIWQTDAQGIYDHPEERNTADRDREFQFYGSVRTDDEGRYAFRTIVPGEYAPRPRHIHFKVFFDGREYLTSQIYFNLPGDSVRASRRELIMPVENGSTSGSYTGRFDITINRGSGSRRATASQSEGPFYPRADVSRFDNDLLVR